MARIGIILGSTRPNRNGEQVARWVLDIASQRDDAEFELVDLRDYPLPHLDEPMPPWSRCRHHPLRICRRRSASTRTTTPGSGPRRSPRSTAS